jgi:hypothetical protein
MLVPTNEPGIGPIAAAAFPSNRKAIHVAEFCGPRNVNSYWDGGSRGVYAIVNLETNQVWRAPTSHPHFDRKPTGERCGELEVIELPPNCALVQGGTFCGKPATVTVYLHPDNMVKLLPAPVELDSQHRQALGVICGVKGGYRQDEFQRRGLGEYHAGNVLVAGLAERKLIKVNKAGAIQATIEGHNAHSAR